MRSLPNVLALPVVLLLGLALAWTQAVEIDDDLLARLEPLSSRMPLDASSQDVINKALYDTEDEVLEAVAAVQSRLLTETRGTIGTPGCFGTYAGTTQQYPRDCCEVCAECIAKVQGFVNGSQARQPVDSPVVAAEFYTGCISDGTMGVDACTAARGNISADISMAKRAAQLCLALGACRTNLACRVPVNFTLLAHGTNSTLVDMDLCTKEGVVGGASTLPLVNNTGKCAKDSDCSGGKTCDMKTATPSCTCSNGIDTCVSLGTCQAMCDLDSTKAQLATLNSVVRACDNDTMCTGAIGEQCVASDQCLKATCPTGNNSIVMVPCAKVCAPALRLATSAQISDDGKSIGVTLNSAALPSEFLCSALFDNATAVLLGASAWCAASGTHVTITLVPESTVVANNKLFIKAGQTVLKDMLVQSALFAAGNVTVANNTAISAGAFPVVKVLAPQFITIPNSAAAAVDVWIDASQAFDPTGRPLKAIKWTVDADPSAHQALRTLANSTNYKASVQDKMKLMISAASLFNTTATDHLQAGVYTVTVEAYSWLGISTAMSVSFEVKLACTAPVLSIIGGTTQEFVISQGIKIDSVLDASSVCANDEVVYSWASSDPAWPVITADISTRKTLIIPGPVAGVSHGTTKTITLTAYLKQHNATKVTVSIALTAIGSPLLPALKAPSGDVKTTATIKLDATASADPDDPYNKIPFTYAFSCSIVGSLAPCTAGALGTQAGGVWTVPVSQLAVDKQYQLTATMSKSGRSTSASTTIKVVDGALRIPSGKIIRQCGSACPPKHSANEPLSLSLQLDAGYETAVIAWSGPAGTSGSAKDLIISSLPRTLGEQVTVTASMTLAGQNGTTTITVPLNHAPYCRNTEGNAAASCISAAAVKDGSGAAKDTFPNAAFLVSVSGIEDGGGGKLTYEYGLVTAGRQVPAIVSELESYTMSGLPSGQSTVYACAIDGDSARLCLSTTVTVNNPPANFNAAAALDTFDVSQAASTGDVSALTKVAMSVSNIASFVTTTTTTNTTNTTAIAEAKAKVDAKAASLITSLATTVDVRDPQAMQTVVSAVVSLGKASSNMTAETKSQVLNVASKGIAAMKTSKKPVTPDLASQLMSGLSLGSLKSPKSLKTGRNLLALSAAESAALTALTDLLAPMGDISDLLAATANPSTKYVPAGDMGLYVSVTNQPGRALAPITLQAGSLADNTTSVAKDMNAVVTFAGQYTGPCTTTELNGTDTTSQCTDGNVRVSALYFEDPTIFTDVKTAPLLTAQGLSSIAAASGVVQVSVSGSAADATLPCATTGTCAMNISVPLLTAPSANQTTVCLRVEGLPTGVSFAGYPNGTGYSVAEVLPATSVPPTGAATCQTSRSGSYLMALATPTPRAAGVTEVVTTTTTTTTPTTPANTTAYTFEVTFQMDYSSLATNAVKMEAFKLETRTAMSKAANLPLANVLIKSIVQGSVVVTFDIYTPNNWTATEVNALATVITSNPGIIFDSTFKSTYGVTGVTARTVSTLPPAPVSTALALGLGIGLGVGGTLIIVTIVVIIMRRKRMGVEPRGRQDPEA